ncbi:MAG: HNH endonuclease [Nitrososphaerota archaeon]|nr:HNH endonuclease [Candidatus Bathyarchaeota archaeon]MDW8194560.1 HNH endonuclease [Nitrososphaerota archaeon]
MVNGQIRLTLQDALTFLYGWSHWHRVVSANPKYYPGKSLFLKGLKAAEKGLMSPCRKTVIHLVKLGKCVSCGLPVPEGSGDHVIPISKGGTQSVENYIPLCRKCNSSKGSKDFLEWWISQGRQIEALNHDALIVYLRLKHRFFLNERTRLAPWYICEAVRQARRIMPRFWIAKKECEAYSLLPLNVTETRYQKLPLGVKFQ